MTSSSSTTGNSHRVLVIGGGGIGERHVRCFLATGRCTVAVAEVNPTRLAELTTEYRIPCHTNAVAMLDAGRFNCEVIATLGPLDLAKASAVVIRSCHALIEKPRPRPAGLAKPRIQIIMVRVAFQTALMRNISASVGTVTT